MTSIRSFMKKLFTRSSSITVVSGLPRSGTSMMMSALKAGGMGLVVDGERAADANNPKGYYEFERVKKLPTGDVGWLDMAQGKAVKIVSALLEFLPEAYSYRVIFMERNIDEILASQSRMLARSGKTDEHPVSDAVLRQSYEEHLLEVKQAMAENEWMETLYVSYNETLRAPHEMCLKVAAFLDGAVKAAEMERVIDPSLYREQK